MSAPARGALWLSTACLLLSLGVWANTGTLAPYGATLDKPLVSDPCKYLLNIDHFHFKAAFLMLDGAPRDQWEFSVVLRVYGPQGDVADNTYVPPGIQNH